MVNVANVATAESRRERYLRLCPKNLASHEKWERARAAAKSDSKTHLFRESFTNEETGNSTSSTVKRVSNASRKAVVNNPTLWSTYRAEARGKYAVIDSACNRTMIGEHAVQDVVENLKRLGLRVAY